MGGISEKEYFENVKEGDKVFGVIYGEGQVRNVYDGFFTFEVEYRNGQVVPYTSGGIPGWNTKLDFQTVAYFTDIDFRDFDFTPSEKEVTVKKIWNWRKRKELEMKCPSGIWVDVEKCPSQIVEDYIADKKFFLFRKKIIEGVLHE